MKKITFTLSAFALMALSCWGLFALYQAHPKKSEKDGYKNFLKGLAADNDEWERTADPYTRTIPTDRLVKAYEELRAEESAGTTAFDPTRVEWNERGPSNVGGRTRALMIDPNDPTGKTLWAGSVGGGLWKNKDVATAGWTKINDNLDVLAISSMAYNPGNTKQFYFGTGEGWLNADAQRGAGIWESLDGGASWNRVPSTSTSDFIYVNKIVVAPNGDAYAATSTGLFKRAGGTGSFVRLNLGAPLTDATANFTDIEIGYLGDGSRKLYTVGVKNYFSASSEGTFYVSANDGLTWTASNMANPAASVRSFEYVTDNAYAGLYPGVNRVELACNGNTVYALCQQRYLGKADPEILQDYLKLPVNTAGLPTGVTGLGAKCIIKSTDGGLQWSQGILPGNTELSTSPTAIADYSRNQCWYDIALAVDPNDPDVVYTGAIDFWKSVNGGLGWEQLSDWQGLKPVSPVHSDHHAMLFHPGSSSLAYFGGDGGIYMSTNLTDPIPAIVAKNKDFNVTQYYGVEGRNEAGSNYFIAGAQDNGTQQYNSEGVDETYEVSGGDGCFTAVDQLNSNKQISSYVYNNYYRRSDGRENVRFSSVGSGSNDGRFVNPIDLADGRDILYTGGNTDSIYRWRNVFGTVSKQVIDLDLLNPAANSDRKPTAITVSPNNYNTVYVGDSRGRLYRLNNAEGTPSLTVISDPSWEGETGGFFWISSIDVLPSADGADNDILISASNYGVKSVWVSRDGGASWSGVEGNLPDIPVRWAVFDPRNPARAFIATELGVFGTEGFNGNSTTWKRNTNFPFCRVDMLRVRQSDKVLIAATHGRGLYTSNPLPADVIPVFTLHRFSGTRQHNTAQLAWAASHEDKLGHYEVERKYGSGVFQLIGSVLPLNGADSSSYSFTDGKVQYSKDPVYRLKMVFKDGQVQYSPEVGFGTATQVTASFNTAASELMLQSEPSSKPLRVQVFNMAGQLFLARTVSAGMQRVPLSELERGMYVIVITDEGNRQQKTVKIFKP